METKKIKHRLREYYEADAVRRDHFDKMPWKFAERDEFLMTVKNENKRTLLEIGAGTGQDSEFFMRNRLDVTAIDLTPAMIARCREKGIDARVMDVSDIESIGRGFDCVWSMNCLLHIPGLELTGILRKINSVLNENGLFYFGVYGGDDREGEYTYGSENANRFFSFMSDETFLRVVREVFDVVRFRRLNEGTIHQYHSAVLRKRPSSK